MTFCDRRNEDGLWNNRKQNSKQKRLEPHSLKVLKVTYAKIFFLDFFFFFNYSGSCHQVWLGRKTWKTVARNVWMLNSDSVLFLYKKQASGRTAYMLWVSPCCRSAAVTGLWDFRFSPLVRWLASAHNRPRWRNDRRWFVEGLPANWMKTLN